MPSGILSGCRQQVRRPVSSRVSRRQATARAARRCRRCRTFSALGGDYRSDSDQRPSPSRQNEPPRIRGHSRGVPLITLEVRTKGGGHEDVRCLSGASLLRDVMIENLVSVELFDKWGKVWQCGGSGKCGACMVKAKLPPTHDQLMSSCLPGDLISAFLTQVLKGKELLSDRTEIEEWWLKHKARNCRLTCQAWVGNGDNSGDIEVSLD